MAEELHPATHEVAARRPLVLASAARMQVDSESRSLVVRRQHAAVQRFPIDRVDRVICARGASWSGDAITLCVAEGITITWVDGRGNPVGDLLPRLANPSSLDAVLDRFLQLPRWAESYGNWLKRRRFAIVLRWAKHRCERGWPLTRGEYDTAIRTYVQNAVIQGVCSVEMLGWCRGVAAARLNQAGLRTRYWAYGGQSMELAEDVAGLLWAELNFEYGAFASSPKGTRAVATVFEARSAQRTNALAEHLALLHTHVCRAVEAWL